MNVQTLEILDPSLLAVFQSFRKMLEQAGTNTYPWGLPWWLSGKEPACNAGDAKEEDPMEKEINTHSSILAWGVPWTEESGKLQSMGPHRVRHDSVTENTHFKPLQL